MTPRWLRRGPRLTDSLPGVSSSEVAIRWTEHELERVKTVEAMESALDSVQRMLLLPPPTFPLNRKQEATRAVIIGVLQEYRGFVNKFVTSTASTHPNTDDFFDTLRYRRELSKERKKIMNEVRFMTDRAQITLERFQLIKDSLSLWHIRREDYMTSKIEDQ